MPTQAPTYLDESETGSFIIRSTGRKLKIIPVVIYMQLTTMKFQRAICPDKDDCRFTGIGQTDTPLSTFDLGCVPPKGNRRPSYKGYLGTRSRPDHRCESRSDASFPPCFGHWTQIELLSLC
jgi:hypothetical protein